jgi:hypothetical protein
MFRFIHHDTRPNALGALAAGALTVLFCLLLLAHDPLVFWNDDYEISILPVCADIARAWNHAEFPLLSPYSWVCGNLAGEFQYGVFSVFINALIVLIWRLPLLFAQQAAALSITHLAVLSAGAFMLARGRNLSIANSIFVALIASLSGWMICWGASDWFGALGAFAWLPWAWWAAERALDSKRTRWRFLWPAPFVYLLVTGGFPYTVLMLALVLAWFAFGEIFRSHELTRIMQLVTGVALGLALSAPAWLALLEYMKGSARTGQDPSAHFQWLVPWNAWPGLVLPGWTVNWPDFSSRMMPHSATELACGLIPVPLIISGFFIDSAAFWKRVRWETVLLICVAALAMIPTAGVFRWSFRWLPLFHLVLALCAAEALQMIAKHRESKAGNIAQPLRSVAHHPATLAFGFVIVIVLTAKFLGLAGEHLFPLAWISLALTLSWLILDKITQTTREWLPPAIIFAALLTTYLSIPPNCGVPKYNLAQSLLRPEPLDPYRLYLSFYPPPESAYRTEIHPGAVGQTVRPGSTSIWAGLRFVNGYSPIRPAGVAREFATSIHGEIDPHMGEWLAWSEARADALLDHLGVDGIIIAREFNFSPQPSSEWRLVVTNNEARVYHRGGDPIRPVRSVNWDAVHALANVSAITDARNRVSASVEVPPGDRPALLAFSRPYFRGYRAQLDGRPLKVSSLRTLIPLVEIPAGAHGRLTLLYRPNWLVYGGAIALASAAVWIVSALLALGSSHRANSSTGSLTSRISS